MTEAEKRVKAIRLYDNWCETDTEDTLEIYCYEKGRADSIDECIEILKDTSRRNCSHLLDEIVYRAVEQMENLKEYKKE